MNELSLKGAERERRLLSDYDFHPFTKGAGRAGLRLHPQTIQAIDDEIRGTRKQARKNENALARLVRRTSLPRLDPVQGKRRPPSVQ
ncbi:hypothetical protein [Paraburkholderia sp. RL17-347-BIC-D]|uniref:hypothetical protein n=1 Tax=Paraburkholderia sp. RL17-347-BIC-D TaxID=3031632 RepID=UPI0038B97A9C